MKVESRGLNVYLRKVQSGAKKLSNTSDLARAISIVFAQETLSNFILEKDPFDRPWQPSRRALRYGGQTLTDTGLLRNSFVPKSGKDYAEISTRIAYASPHQQGAGRLPERQMLGYGPRIEKETLRLSERFMVDAFNG